MRVKDVFNTSDLARTLFLGTAIFLLFGTMFSLFLHAQYSTQINTVKNDLVNIKEWMHAKSDKMYKHGDFEQAREYKEVAIQAGEMSKKIRSPPVSPSSMTYFHYWIASAAFTKVNLTPEQMGLPQNTVDALNTLSTQPVLDQDSWLNHPEFKGISIQSGRVEQFLPKLPNLEPQFYTFYIFVFITAFVSLYLGIKNKYSFDILPQLIYGVLMPTIFFALLTLSGILTKIGIIKFYDASQVNIMTYLLVFIIMAVICAFAGMIVSQIKQK